MTYQTQLTICDAEKFQTHDLIIASTLEETEYFSWWLNIAVCDISIAVQRRGAMTNMFTQKKIMHNQKRTAAARGGVLRASQNM